MNLNNLKEGMELKNYKALCAVICVRPTTGEARQKQLDILSEYVQYKKSGNKYIIEKIINPVKGEIPDESKSPYIKLIETLIVAKLVKSGDSSVEYTYKELIQALNMASENYKAAYYKTSYNYIYNNIAPITMEIYNDWMRYMYGNNKKKIKSALESMEKRKLITYEEVQYVCYQEDEIDENKYCGHNNQVEYKQKYIHREPTKTEWESYLKICRCLLEKHGCDNIDEIKQKKLTRIYEEELSSEINEKLNWKYMYKKVRIHHILRSCPDLLDQTKRNFVEAAAKEKTAFSEKALNNLILNMINNVGNTNHKNAVSQLEEWEKNAELEGWLADGDYSLMPNNLFSILYRTKENYLPGWYILSDYYITGDEESARDKGKKLSSMEFDNENDELGLIN